MATDSIALVGASGGIRLGWRRGLKFTAMLAIVGVASWWVVTAGAVTVFRIVYHNATGIQDFQRFPKRLLSPSAQPAPFQESSDTSVFSQEMADRVEQVVAGNDTVAFLVVQNGQLVFERYYDGWSAKTPSQSFSMGKSFLSMLVGVALRDGTIRSLDDSVIEYVPELRDRGFSQVTIEDVLQMSSGSNYVEDENPFGVHARFTYTPNLEDEILKLSVPDGPGRWDYKSGDTALLTLILDRALGTKTVTDYTQEVLWSPLGMESPGLWTVSDKDRLEKTWCCMAATARDYAKLGALYLHGGKAGGRQVIPAEWVERSVGSGLSGESVLNDHHRMMGVWNYNYHWWLVSEEERDFMAAGHLGQFLYVNPSSETVVVRLGRSQGDLKQSEWIDFFQSVASRANTG